MDLIRLSYIYVLGYVQDLDFAGSFFLGYFIAKRLGRAITWQSRKLSVSRTFYIRIRSQHELRNSLGSEIRCDDKNSKKKTVIIRYFENNRFSEILT